MDLISHYPLGARVFAIQDSGICHAGEAGLVVEEYETNGRQGRTILFAGGDYDGFSQDDLARFTLPAGSVDPQTATYQFVSVSRLAADRHRGVFDFTAFPPYSEWLADKEAADLASSCAQVTRKVGPGRM